jgi:hypothetical protein
LEELDFGLRFGERDLCRDDLCLLRDAERRERDLKIEMLVKNSNMRFGSRIMYLLRRLVLEVDRFLMVGEGDLDLRRFFGVRDRDFFLLDLLLLLLLLSFSTLSFVLGSGISFLISTFVSSTFGTSLCSESDLTSSLI